jgi:hypothetical protein
MGNCVKIGKGMEGGKLESVCRSWKPWDRERSKMPPLHCPSVRNSLGPREPIPPPIFVSGNTGHYPYPLGKFLFI